MNRRGPSVGVAALSEAGFRSPAEVMIPLKFSAFSLSHVLPPVWEAFYSFNLCWSASKSGTRQSLLEELGVVEAHPGLEGEPPRDANCWLSPSIPIIPLVITFKWQTIIKAFLGLASKCQRTYPGDGCVYVFELSKKKKTFGEPSSTLGWAGMA